MSKRKDERGENLLAVFVKASELLAYTIRAVCNETHFRARYRYENGSPCVDLARQIMHCVTFAEMVCRIIDSFDGDRGIGLGSQVSQLLAVSYLSDLDHEIKERFRIHCYSRYSDDIVLVCPDREKLLRCYEVIRARLAGLGLSLNPKSTMHSLKQGVVYLKFRFVIKPSGKVIYYATSSLIVRARRRFRRMIGKYKRGEIGIEAIRQSFNSWASFVMYGCRQQRVYHLKHQIERALA